MVQLAAQVTDAAIAARNKWGVPASVCLAQYGLESGWGKKVTGTFNYFGNKWDGVGTYTVDNTHEEVNGEMIPIKDKFKNFSSLEEAFDFHGQLLATHSAYTHAMTLKDNPEAFANALTGVYATDSQYGTKLIQIMRGSGLEKYDT